VILPLVVRARRLRAARGVVVARDVTLAAAPGDVVAVEGPNGSGKSTLLAAAAGLLPADSASVRPGSVGYAPERAGTLPRIPLQRWLLGLARTAADAGRRPGRLALPARPGPDRGGRVSVRSADLELLVSDP
jgi:energy-coupling factor transporter ATP-binding protein EcfA2